MSILCAGVHHCFRFYVFQVTRTGLRTGGGACAGGLRVGRAWAGRRFANRRESINSIDLIGTPRLIK